MLDGRPVRVSVKPCLADALVALAIGGRAAAARTRRLRRAVRMTRSMGSAALSLAYVANGRFDAFGQTIGLSAWDVAAAGLIAERAGAAVTALDGGPWFRIDATTPSLGVLAAPPAHHARLLELLASPDPTQRAPGGVRCRARGSGPARPVTGVCAGRGTN